MSDAILHPPEAEKAVLAAMLSFPYVIPVVAEIVKYNDFYDENHQQAFRAMFDHHRDGKPVELVALAEILKKNKGAVETLASLEDPPTGETAKYYARKVKEAAARRDAYTLAGEIQGMAECGGDIAPLVDLLSNCVVGRETAKGRCKVLDLHELLQTTFPERECLLSPIIQTQSLSMIHAWRGLGKTHVGLGVAYAVSSGGKFLKWEAPQPRGVIYLDGEMPGNALQERLAAIVAASDKEPLPGYFKIITPDMQEPGGVPDLSTVEGQTAVNALLTDETALIVVDNISCLCRTGRENEAESWIPVQGWALRQRAAGRSVLFIHHSGKNGEQRGASKREDILDTVIKLKRPIDYEPSQGAAFEVIFEKGRALMGEDATSFEARLTTNPISGLQEWVYKDVAQTTFERVVELANEGLSQAEIANELQINKSNVSRYCRKGTEQGLIHSPKK